MSRLLFSITPSQHPMSTLLERVKPLCAATAKLLRPCDALDSDFLSIDVDPELKFFRLLPFGMGINGARCPSSYWAQTGVIRKRFLEAREVSTHLGRGLEVPTTDTSCLIIEALFPSPHQRVFESEDAEVVWQHRVAQFTSGLHRAELQAKSRARIEPDFAFAANEGYHYMLHQTYAAKASIGADYGLFCEQGTGKTPIVVMRIDAECVQKHRPYRALITCPGSVMSNWNKELRDVSTKRGEVYMLRGSKMGRAHVLLDVLRADEIDWVAAIVSWDTMWRMADTLASIEWDLAVIDESHWGKGDRTKRHGGLMKIRDAAEHRMALTGTPIANSPADLFTQLEFLHEGLSGFSSKKNFKNFYCSYKEVAENHNIFMGAQNVPLLQERLARNCFLVTKEEALPDLPAKAYDIIDVEMSERQKAVYKLVATRIRAEIEEEMETSKNKSITVNNALVKLLRLAQITSGFAKLDGVFDPETGDLLEVGQYEFFNPNPKMEALVEKLRDEPATSKQLVWARWVPSLEGIHERLNSENLGGEFLLYYGKTSREEREIIVDRFNNDTSVKGIVGNPTCGGIGLNLLGKAGDMHCDHASIYEQGWEFPIRAQLEDRNCRKGTTWQCRYTDFCVPNSIDEEIRKRVLKKRLNAAMVQDIRVVLTEVMRCLEL